MEPHEETSSFLDLSELALHRIGDACYPDAAALLRLSLACRATRGLDRAELWHSWVVGRFGEAALPAEPPSGGLLLRSATHVSMRPPIDK